jgi:hypothetical protein
MALHDPKYPQSAALEQAEWLARTLGPGWEPHTAMALVDRPSWGTPTTKDPNVYTFWAERGPLRVKPVQWSQPHKEYKDHELALLAAESLQYTCDIEHPRGAWSRWALLKKPTHCPREAVRAHLAALSEQIADHQAMLTKALVALQEEPSHAVSTSTFRPAKV